MKTVEERLVAIEKRNKRVEQDKAWETSWVRRISIATLTYIIVVCYLSIVIHNSRPFINALVPVIGYLLSTLAITIIRDFWEKNKK